jgi:hypothetical protein
MSWREEIDRMTMPALPDRYRLKPTRDGVVVRCDTCSRDITEPDEFVHSILSECVAHERTNHG